MSAIEKISIWARITLTRFVKHSIHDRRFERVQYFENVFFEWSCQKWLDDLCIIFYIFIECSYRDQIIGLMRVKKILILEYAQTGRNFFLETFTYYDFVVRFWISIEKE